MGYLEVYTEKVQEPHYPRALADSVHMAYTEPDGNRHPLNQGYGILYAEADIRPDNTIAPRGIRKPVILALEEGCVILAELVDEAGEAVSEDSLILWKTLDFLHFGQERVERGQWKTRYEEAQARLELPESLWEGIRQRFTVPDEKLKKVEQASPSWWRPKNT